MWRFKHFMPKEQSGLDGRTFDIGNLKIQVRNAIAEGGFSCVYLARDVHSGKQYGLKHMICNDVESLDLVKKEINVMKSLKGHPNVVALYAQTIMDFGRTKEAFLVMEFCEKSLVSVLESRGAGFFDEKQILLIFRDVCNAVFAMHCQLPPIAHRDLKAENLLLGSDGVWKLCDFGSTSTQHKRYERPEEMGIEEDNIRKHTTPAYRAPEMWDLFTRELISEKVDIWALGCLLYRICYFKSAFDGESKLQILNGNYRLPELPKYSTPVTDLINDMLRPSPDARPDIMQVWNRVNEQLPLEMQKSAPDRPISAMPTETQLHIVDGKDEGMVVPPRRTTPSRTPPPLPPTKEQVQNLSSMQSNSKSAGSSGKLGAFWSTVHAQESSVSDDNGPKFDEEPFTNSKPKNRQLSPQENRHHSLDSTSPPKDHHERAGNHLRRSVAGNVQKKYDDGPSEGYEIRFFSNVADHGSDTLNSSGNKAPKSEIAATSYNETFSSFVAEFDNNKLSEIDKLSKEKLQAEVERLKEELKQLHAEKAEIASKYEKLAAICRSQRQEIQELKQAIASGSPSQNKDSLKVLGGSQVPAQQSQKPSGSWQSSSQRDKIEGAIWDLQQGMMANSSSAMASSESVAWHAFSENHEKQPVPKYNPKMSVRTTSKGTTAKPAKSSEAWGFSEDHFTANPEHSQLSSTATLGNSQRFNSSATATETSSTQPAGWAGF